MKQAVAKFKKTLGNTLVMLPVLAVLSGLVAFGAVSAFSGDRSPVGDCDDICIALTPEGMKPDELAVKVGDFVQFNSADGKRHNISLGEGAGGTEGHGHAPHEGKHEHVSGYASGDFEADEAWRLQFKEPGTYHLHDHYNPELNILVIVYEEKAASR